MKQVLIVGSGGREHALAWKLRQSPHVRKLYVAPGNGGTTTIAENVPIHETDIEGIVRFVQERNVDLTVIGPEAPLALGLTDRLREAGYTVFGPSQASARLETSKVFAKHFMTKHGIPTATYCVASDLSQAYDALNEIGLPCAIKADGLAAGKGVTVCHTRQEAEAALRAALVENRFGEAGRTIIIEEGLSGQEVSVLALCDGERVTALIPAQDHKAVFDGDRGPNTGGMGSYAPAPVLNTPLLEQVQHAILAPVIAGMRDAGTPYRGILYAGLMLTAAGPQVLEFNARFGDPETQSVLPLLDSDLFELLFACAEGSLDPRAVRWSPGSCVCVVCTSPGYPGPYLKGLPITGLEKAEQMPGVLLFHAGTTRTNDGYITSGGRVLGVTCRAANLHLAVEGAYRAVHAIHFEGMHYRTDIAARALKLSSSFQRTKPHDEVGNEH